MKNILNKGLIGLVILGNTLNGCDNKPVFKKDPRLAESYENIKETIEEYETKNKVSEVKVVGRSYSPGFNFSNKFHHNREEVDHFLNIDMDDQYFLFVELNNKIYVKQVEKNFFSNHLDGEILNAEYIEKKYVTYETGTELEKINENIYDIEIIKLEKKISENYGK